MRRSVRAAFTLVELLVGIGLIALAGALLWSGVVCHRPDAARQPTPGIARADSIKAGAEALARQAVAARRRGDYVQERTYDEAALALYRQLHDPVSIARELRDLGRVAVRQGDPSAARRWFQE